MTRPATHLELIPLGGLGEFGMNLMVFRVGDDCLVVDAGMMFPGAEHLGVDVIIPDLGFLDDCGTIHGVVLTHGHEDHIGALPWLLVRHDLPVWCTPYTEGLVRARLAEHDLLSGRSFNGLPADGGEVRVGPFTIEAIPVAHSIPQAVMLALHTPLGTVVHTADFKLDPDPLDGISTDMTRLRRIGDAGVLALLSDSTNAERPGFTPGERSCGPALSDLISAAPGRVFVTTFSSNIHRIRQVAEIGRRHGRRTALVGTSLQRNAEVAERLGLLGIPGGSRIRVESLMERHRDEVVAIVTGSQGEPMSAMARIAVDRHRDVAVEQEDLVIHSARVIPGNQKSIGRMIDHLLRRGARVVTGEDARVHVSGHPSQEELRLMLHALRPAYLVPIHGEHRQLRAHADLARRAGMAEDSIVVADSGDVIALNESECSVVDRVHAGHVFIDAALDEVDFEILRDRRKIAGDGIVVPVIAVDRESGAIGEAPEIVTRGFVPEFQDDGLLEDAGRQIVDLLAEATPEERGDEGVMKARIQTELKRFLRRRTQRRPLIIPVIVEF